MMWWISAIGNAIGIIAGFAKQEVVMHIMFAISFMAFSHKYAMIAWRLVYDKRVEQPEARSDVFLANEVNSAGMLLAIYVVMVVKIGVSCILFAPLQGVLIWVISLTFGKNPPSLRFLICYIIELIGALIIAL